MYNNVIKIINNLLDNSEKDIVWVAIDGPSASGKSSLGNFINDNFICNVFHMDDFFLPPEKKTAERLNETGGNIDWERFEKEIIGNVNLGQNFTFNVYDCHNLSYFETGKVFCKRLNIVEGVYSMHPQLIDNYDFKIYLDVDSEKQKQRILNRSNEKKLARFVNEWIPLENRYFEETDLKNRCDAVFDTSELF
ncbi:MAG: uridine kinase [Oscillospiraceae bacterium]|nr:uridine kinase [Oscillospiraceae bacterium]